MYAEILHGQYRKQEAHYQAAERIDAPAVVVFVTGKTVRIEWDCITSRRAKSGMLTQITADRIREVYDRFAVKGSRAMGGPFYGNFYRMPRSIAGQVADSVFAVLMDAIGKGETRPEPTAAEPFVVAGFTTSRSSWARFLCPACGRLHVVPGAFGANRIAPCSLYVTPHSVYRMVEANGAMPIEAYAISRRSRTAMQRLNRHADRRYDSLQWENEIRDCARLARELNARWLEHRSSTASGGEATA